MSPANLVNRIFYEACDRIKESGNDCTETEFMDIVDQVIAKHLSSGEFNFEEDTHELNEKVRLQWRQADCDCPKRR